ncbi:MAG: hypothetical protein LBO69_07510 [Ignavibacteria bacterium]|jgi:molybdopterin-guanine dinucleotide biosynthesis protein|nr:hypothetical protein [Ignavibacteria bacterium]
MDFINRILGYNSVSIVGTAKNTGKTTCLNYILERLTERNYNIAVTSIGVDGEKRDVLYDTPKPRIKLSKGNLFVTTEKHYAEKELSAKLLHKSKVYTPLGRLLIARAENEGQVILSGPSDSHTLTQYISLLLDAGADMVIVDGALNRMSLASPAVTDATVLCTGASLTLDMDKLIKHIKYLCELINIEQDKKLVIPADEGVMGIIKVKGEMEITEVAESLFTLKMPVSALLRRFHKVLVNGVLTDSFLKEVGADTNVGSTKLYVRDFSRIFAQPQTYYRYLRRGGKMLVLQRAKLLAICTNPVSPNGYSFEPEVLRSAVASAVDVPVYDIKQCIEFGERKV